MTICNFELERDTTAGIDVLDITDEVLGLLQRSQISNGQVLVFTPGSTASVSTIEYEDGVIEDLRQAIERLVPSGMSYRHDRRWGDGNGYSHVRSALLGPSITVPVSDGALGLGTWQQIVLLDFDNRPRRRRVVVQVSGE